MNKILLCFFLFVLVSSQKTQGQNFEEGFVVSLQNDTLRGFIGGKEYGTNIRFKKLLSDKNPVFFKPAQIKSYSLKAFGETYIGAVVSIDIKPSEYGSLENNSVPKFVRDTIFLQVLVKGKASLYVADDRSNKKHFFIQLGEGEIAELIRIKYLNPTTGALVESDIFRNQLQQLFAGCPQKYSTLDYREPALKKAFITYNECAGSIPVFIQKDIKSEVILYLVLGGSFGKGIYSGDYNSGLLNLSSVKFTSPLTPILGIGIELKPIESKNLHLSETAEFLWKRYSFSNQTGIPNSYQRNVKYAYSSSGIYLTVKYSLNTKLKPYFRIGISESIISEQRNQLLLVYTNTTYNTNYNEPIAPFSKTSFGYFGGVGLSFFKRFFGEFRYESAINSVSPATAFTTTSLNFLVGYRLKKGLE